MNDRLHQQSVRDASRLEALIRTGLLDTPPEPVFDRITRLAADLLDTPVALVSLVDRDRQFFKSSVGMPGEVRETPLSHSFCQYTVSSREPLVVNDARQHPVLRDNAAIEDLGVVAYAGVPMTTRDGHVLGSFCVVDFRPRSWSVEDVELLRALSESVVAAIELRQEAEEHRRTAERLGEREARVRLMVSQLPVLTWSTDRDLRLHGGEGLGVSPGELVGVDVRSLFTGDPRALETVARAHHQALRGQPERYELEWKGRSFDCRAEPLRSTEGEIIGVVGVAYDVTEQRRAREARESARRRFQGLVEHGSDIVALVAPDGTIVYESPSVQRVLGYDPAEVIGENFARFIHPDDLPETDAIFRELLSREGLARTWRLRVQTADGGHRALEAVAKNAVGVPSLGGIVFTARDVTEEVEIQRQLDERKEQLVHSQKLEALGRLAAGVAHDFNNLLTVISAHAEFLREMAPGAQAAEEVDGIADTTERAAELTRQLLAFSGQQVTEPRMVDLSEVVQRLNRMLQRLIGENITLVTRREPELPRVWIDPARLEQVVVNLVVNARDAMPEGGALTIRLRTEEHAGCTTQTGTLDAGRYTVLEVADQGIGMDADTRSRIFEPFFTTKGSAGTGLGLATSFGIITEAGGGIDVETVPGHGSTFRVHLPVATDPPVQDAAPAAPRSVGRGSERILLVEDDADVRMLAARALESGGYSVLQAGGAAEAVDLAASESVDLLISDVVLPDESGPDLHDRLRDHHGELPVLFVSGYPSGKLQSPGALGARRRFLPKPFVRKQLLEAVRSTLDGD